MHLNGFEINLRLIEKLFYFKELNFIEKINFLGFTQRRKAAEFLRGAVNYILMYHFNYTNENKLKEGERHFSLMKLAKFFSQHLHPILTSEKDEKIKMQLEKYCRYEKRNDRINTMEKY